MALGLALCFLNCSHRLSGKSENTVMFSCSPTASSPATNISHTCIYTYLDLSRLDCSQLALIQTQTLSRLSYSIDCTGKVRYNKASYALI